MIETHSESELIQLFSDELRDIDQNIKIKLNQKYKSCDEKYGYISDIKITHRDRKAIISRDGCYCSYNVKYTFTSIKPQPNHIYKDCIVHNVFKQGILCLYHTIQIFVPLDNNGWLFRNGIIFLEDKQIKVSDRVDVLIEHVQYMNHQFQCIGKLIKD